MRPPAILKQWVIAWVAGVVGLAVAEPLVTVEFGQAGGNSGATFFFQNTDSGVIYDEGQFKFGDVLGGVAQAVKGRNPSYSTNTLESIVSEWNVSISSDSGEVYSGWNPSLNSGVLDLTHGPGWEDFDYDGWHNATDNPNQDEMAVSVNFGDQLDFNNNGQFDPASEALLETTNIVQDAFTGVDGGGSGYTTDANAIGVIPESVPLQLSGMTFEFTSSTNMTYTVFSSTNLTSGIWMIETNFTGSGTTNFFEMVPTHSNQFFKVERVF